MPAQLEVDHSHRTRHSDYTAPSLPPAALAHLYDHYPSNRWRCTQWHRSLGRCMGRLQLRWHPGRRRPLTLRSRNHCTSLPLPSLVASLPSPSSSTPHTMHSRSGLQIGNPTHTVEATPTTILPKIPQHFPQQAAAPTTWHPGSPGGDTIPWQKTRLDTSTRRPFYPQTLECTSRCSRYTSTPASALSLGSLATTPRAVAWAHRALQWAQYVARKYDHFHSCL